MKYQQYLLILASQSPRRAELLRDANFQFAILPPSKNAEEDAAGRFQLAEKIEDYVLALAAAKGEDVFAKLTQLDLSEQLKLRNDSNDVHELHGMIHEARTGNRPLVILAADTVAYCDDEMLGKPCDRGDARRMLSKMSGREHQVITSVTLLLWPNRAVQSHVLTTTMRMDRISDHELEQFLDTGDWQGKAGAFGYQDGLDWVHVVDGLESNVVGLPIEMIAPWVSELIAKQ